MMKRHSLVRVMSVFATAFCLASWFPFFLHVTRGEAWEWNSFTLFDIVALNIRRHRPSGHISHVIAMSGIVAGCFPLLTGFHGSIRPRSKVLLAVSVTCSTLVVASVVIIYSAFGALYGQRSRPIVEVGAGTFLSLIAITLEIVAGVISRRKSIS